MNTFSLHPDSNLCATGCLPVSESTCSIIDYFAKPWGPLSRNNLAHYSNSLLQKDLQLHFRSPSSIFAPQNSTVYDALGNLLSVTDPLSQTTSYAYDDLGRTTSVTDPLAGVTSYAHDAVGNRLSLTDPLSNVTSWVYDDLDRVKKGCQEP